MRQIKREKKREKKEPDREKKEPDREKKEPDRDNKKYIQKVTNQKKKKKQGINRQTVKTQKRPEKERNWLRHLLRSRAWSLI